MSSWFLLISNDFYGWGHEDTALQHRINVNNYTVYLPDEKKTSKELYHKDTNKIPELTNNKRVELLINDELNWKMNGVQQLQYKILKSVNLNNNNNIIKITVDIE